MQIFFGKVMSLLFNMLSIFVIAFLQKSKCLLVSWLQSLFSVILEPLKMKYDTAYTFPASICYEVMGSAKKESEKVGLKINIQKTKIMASGPSLHGK